MVKLLQMTFLTLIKRMTLMNADENLRQEILRELARTDANLTRH